MYLFWKPPYYLRQPFRCDQVLTGVLPHSGSNQVNIITYIRASKRPSRPIHPLWNRNQRLQRPVWDVISTGWSHKPEERCELSVMHHVFLVTSQQEQEVQDAKLGGSNTQYDRNPAIAEMSQTLK